MAKTIRGIKVVIDAETTGLGKALQDVNKKSRDSATELRKVEAALKFNPKDTELLAQKQKLLGDQVAVTREKLDKLRAAQGQVNEQFKKGEISEEQYRAFQREIIETESKLKHFEKQLRDTGLTAEQLGKKLQDAGKKMTDIGKSLSLKVTAPIMGLGAVVAKTGMEFEAAMSEVGAISGATGDDLKALEEMAKEMGATTKFSASEAAEGLKYMAMAGWDTQQQLDGLPGVLNLAAASGENLGIVSDIVTDAMTAFGMEAARAGEFADTLAAAASNSNTNVSMLGESFKYVAPVAGALGYEAKDTAIALGLMANAGIKSSQAGTAMRTLLTNLVKPTKESGAAMNKLGISLTDSEGNMKSLEVVMGDLRNAFKNLDPDQQAFYAAQIAGQQGMSGLLAIVNAGEDDFNNLSDAINNSTGEAERMSKEMQDNLQGRLTELKSAIEGAALQFYEAMLPALEKVVAITQKAVDWFAKLSPKTKQTITIVAGLAAAIGPLLIILGPIVSTIGSLIMSIGAMSTAMAGGAGVMAGLTAGFPALGTAIALITGPVGWVVGAIAALVAGGIALYKNWEKIMEMSLPFKAAILAISPPLTIIVGAIKLFQNAVSDAIPAVELFSDEVSESTQEAVGAYLELEDKATKALNTLAWGQREITKKMANELTKTYDTMTDQILAAMDKRQKEELSQLEKIFASTEALTEEEQAKALASLQEHQENERQAIIEGRERIEEILRGAAEEKRAITEAERLEILTIQEHMKDDAIRVMSESEAEQKVILERLKIESEKITALQAAEIVQNSVKQKEEVIAEAEEQCNETIAAIIRQRDETGSISKEQAERMIEEAERQRDETIGAAEETHKRIVGIAEKQASEHAKWVDWETGEVKTKWEVMKEDIAKKTKEIKNKTIKEWKEIGEATVQAWEDVKEEVSSSASRTRDFIDETWGEIEKITSITWNDIFSFLANLWDRIRTTVEKKWGEIYKEINTITDGIKNLFNNLVKSAWNWGENLLREFISGI